MSAASDSTRKTGSWPAAAGRLAGATAPASHAPRRVGKSLDA
ncbi:MAG: hypothetical protein OXI66_03220 [Boseongicola sp.]|nr:hypothetical protein [Boseongicola sp.]